MSDPTISCPDCGGTIKLTEAMAGPLLIQTKRDMAEAQAAALAAQKAQIEAQATQDARAAQAEQLAKLQEADAARAVELAALRAQDKTREAKLAEAQSVQARALKMQNELAERAREMDLTIQKQVSEQTEAARAKLAVEAEALAADRLKTAQEAATLKLVEKDQQMETLRRQIEVLTRKVEQGSQQLQGEAAELVLEEQLRQAFPTDTIAEVGKGVRGADCLLVVNGPAGPAGSILWESKNTQNWSPAWLPKLREDMRTSGAEIAVLCSSVRPDGIETFAQIDGIWVVAPRYAVALAAVLRDGVLSVALARGQRDGQATKTEMLYDYLMGPQFKARIEAVAERMDELRAGLAQEQKLMQRLWAAREKQISTAHGAMIGFYGDIQGIGGAAMQQIEALEPGLLEDD